MIRVIAIEDERLIVAGLTGTFHSSRGEIQIRGFFNVSDAIEGLNDSDVDFIILDLWLPGSDPMNNLKCLKEKFPGKPILIFTGEDSLEWRKKMMHAGVNGYICKTADPCEIKRAIEKIIEHGTYFPSVSPDIQYKWKNPLNHTEQRITVLLSEGFRLLAIAKKVHLSVTAVEKTLAKLRKEYQCANNTMLIMVLTEKYYL